jgi:hypothetical protein
MNTSPSKSDDSNPTQSNDGTWWWYDGNDLPHGPYATQIDALRGIMQHIDPGFYKQSWVDSNWFTAILVIATLAFIWIMHK